jgi:hypothetical protein
MKRSMIKSHYLTSSDCCLAELYQQRIHWSDRESVR